MRPTTILLYALPLSTAAVVGFALFVVGAPKAFAGARLYGGTTESVPRLSFRLAAVEHFRGIEAPLASETLEVVVDFEGGKSARWHGSLDAYGMAAVAVDVPGGALASAPRVRVLRDSETLADGRVWLSREAWLEKATRRGGWIPVPGKGPLEVRVALGRGALAVPFSDPIWIEIRRRGGAPIAGASVHVELEGLTLVSPKTRDVLLTSDAEGRTQIVVRPNEHAASVRVVAEHAGERGEWYATLPVVPGAISTRLQDGKLRIESPVERDLVYFALLGERARFAGGPVALEPDGRGGSVQLVPLPPLPPEPVWAEASGEPELASETTVGWPLRVPDEPRGEPRTTFSVPDQLLLDGVPQGERVEAARRGKARTIAGGYTVLALVLASIIVIARARRADVNLRAHLESAGAEAESRDLIARRKVGGIALAVAVLCIALGFAAIALVALYRLG